MDIKLKIWRQKDASHKGKFEKYDLKGVSPEMSFLEMMDYLNNNLIAEGKNPVAFDHDCREGICGSCGIYINGRPHGPERGTTTCELRMRFFKDGQTIVVEPWRSRAFPVIKDLIVDRTALDEVMKAGGFVSIDTGSAKDSNCIPIPKTIGDKAFDAAVCVGCGACVAACKNSSAMLFVAAKAAQLNMLPQGKVEAALRVQKMVEKMDELGFGFCSNTYGCEYDCPKHVSVEFIAKMNRDFLSARVCKQKV
jgi:succinate dehydrogenase / fumarate reductase, iron-sulfur subunit